MTEHQLDQVVSRLDTDKDGEVDMGYVVILIIIFFLNKVTYINVDIPRDFLGTQHTNFALD